MPIELHFAKSTDLGLLLPLVRAYHALEGIADDAISIEAALRPLLGESEMGRIWLIHLDGAVVGYVALCFGYSLEFGGRDAFIDELYVIPDARGRGVGRRAIARVQERAAEWGVRALHLEVERHNTQARRLYLSAGFESRERFFLMTMKSAPSGGGDSKISLGAAASSEGIE